MNNTSRGILASALLLASSATFALPTGLTNITIYDGDYSNSSAWYGKGEDQEVEPGMDRDQKWDLESFSMYGNNQLAMIGGFDFVNGVAGYQGKTIYNKHGRPVDTERNFLSGDIFIDVDNNHILGNATARDGDNQAAVTNTFGYDYVLDVNWLNGTYNVYSLDADSRTRVAFYDANAGSNPWLYVDGGNYLESGTFAYESALTDAQTGFNGGNHYAVSGFDLSFLGSEVDFFVHFTMGCGNDNLMGQATTAKVPEPASMALLALGLFGLIRARKQAGVKA